MSKAKRQRTNPTGLVDIEKDDMTINISQDFKSGALEFYRVTKLELESYNFPNDALLIIHAYSRFSESRSGIGTVGNPDISYSFPAKDFNNSAVTFRLLVKMQGANKLLGTCENIRVTQGDQDTQPGKTLLHVRYENLGERLWKLDAVGGTKPIVVVNNSSKFDMRSRMDKKDAIVRGLIIPQAFEQSLLYLAHYWDAGEEWQEHWKNFLFELGQDEPEDMSDLKQRDVWVSEAIIKFVSRVKFASLAANWEQENG